MILPTPEQKEQWEEEGYLVFEDAIQGKISSDFSPPLIIGQMRVKRTGWIELKRVRLPQLFTISQTHLKKIRFSSILLIIQVTTAH